LNDYDSGRWDDRNGYVKSFNLDRFEKFGGFQWGNASITEEKSTGAYHIYISIYIVLKS